MKRILRAISSRLTDRCKIEFKAIELVALTHILSRLTDRHKNEFVREKVGDRTSRIDTQEQSSGLSFTTFCRSDISPHAIAEVF
jgi:hypothetical protein